jgi:hypothetical protein
MGPDPWQDRRFYGKKTAIRKIRNKNALLQNQKRDVVNVG